jgi:phage regulator Rha-like protein
MSEVVPHERIEKRIFEMRGKKVMLDADLAELYAVETRALNQAVTRNIERFPDDFMFQLSEVEAKDLRSQSVTSNWGGRRYMPYAFTEHGILMLSNVLKSKRAVRVSVQIIRVFVRLRELAQDYHELIARIEKVEKRQDVESREVWKAVRLLQGTVMK